jgi:D-alanyl-lipoteichoic acid acyltransferase DltB (MBOAT superfamily)
MESVMLQGLSDGAGWALQQEPHFHPPEKWRMFKRRAISRMSIPSAGFIVGLMIVAGAIFFLPRGWPRQLLLAICNAAFLATQIPNLYSWIALAGFVGSGFVAGEAVRRQKKPSIRSWLVRAYIILLLLAFMVLKQYQFLDFLIPQGTISRWISIIGLSYMLFRQIHYVVDINENQIEATSLWRYLNYQLNLFGLLAGPIQRYQHFEESWATLSPVLTDRHEMLKAVARLMIGVIKVAMLGEYARHAALKGDSEPISAGNLHGWLQFAMLFYGFPLHLYFNFSGYCDVVIAGAALVGIKMPENFNKPYLARNVIDFWARFHMTLTHWIRDYIFTPLYKYGTEKQWMPANRLAYLCFFVALLLAGIWHGSSWNFVVFGFLHGSAVSINKIWEDRIVRRRGRPGLREYMKSPKIRAVSITATLHFVCFALLFFSPDLSGRVHFLLHFATLGRW